jgi:pSer/pThr/pTyr-binding forkhead associated (FHA) protein
MSCGFCGRENDTGSRFCIDCGKPMNPSAARVGPAYVPSPSGARVQPMGSPCLRCGKPVTPGLPFCGHCGSRVAGQSEPGSCGQCGAEFTKGVDLFCARCGHRVGQRVSIQSGALEPGATKPFAGPTAASSSPKLALLGDGGELLETYTLDRGEAVIGRSDADMKFESDHFMSPVHARLELRNGELALRDLGSRNGTWVFIDQDTKLTDGDLILIGSQLVRFRRLGYPGPHPPEADSTRRMGSMVPTVDVAVLEQLRADGSVRDTLHLSPGRTISVGRETGDWTFPYDSTMSASHAEIRTEDSEFFVHDANSRNGVAMAARGERCVKPGQRILVGDQILRVERV